MKLFILLFVSIPLVYASEVSLDLGQTKTVFNKFSIPKSQNNQLNFSDENLISSYRLTGFIDLNSNHQFYFLYAPLEVTYTFKSTKSFVFNKTNFSKDIDTSVTYKFNSYRLGYIWKFGSESFKYWFGVVGKIRDADISLEQANLTDNYDNIGFVPLLSLGFNLNLFGNVSLYSHTDGLGSSRGSAYDSQIELKLNIESLSVSVGKRILGGGADNEKVYNFAQFDTYYLKTSLNF